ncbi:hypothetical protein CR513_17163, partial [Mucuna pruriens]
MGRKKNKPHRTFCTAPILLSMFLASCGLVYAFICTVLTSPVSEPELLPLVEDNGGCCRGIQNLELWGTAVKWGSEFKVNTSEECCNACKSMCTSNDGPCLCDTWVFCGNSDNCGSKFGEVRKLLEDMWDPHLAISSIFFCYCWLKKQKESLAPEQVETTEEAISWTSGLIFGRGEGIIGLETEYGTLRVKLFPDCAPHSVAYILELLPLFLCTGCQFYRAESRGQLWDSKGNHLKNSSMMANESSHFQAVFGPPFALIQGTLEAQGTIFKKIPSEDCPTIRRGSVAWVGSGPEFFISLANHWEWKKKYTVFGSVLPEDMHIAEKISVLPTISEVWNNVNVTVLEKRVPLTLRRIEKGHENFNTKANSA